MTDPSPACRPHAVTWALPDQYLPTLKELYHSCGLAAIKGQYTMAQAVLLDKLLIEHRKVKILFKMQSKTTFYLRKNVTSQLK